MAQFVRSIHCILLAGFLAASVGCKNSETTSATPPQGEPTGPEPTGPHAAGMRVFNTQGCTRCHAIGDDSTGKGKKRMGPDLSGVARDPLHTNEWLTEYIRDPKSKNSASRMPPFQGKINDEDFKHLIDYLTSLK